jgi:maltose-binding protein MalE
MPMHLRLLRGAACVLVVLMAGACVVTPPAPPELPETTAAPIVAGPTVAPTITPRPTPGPLTLTYWEEEPDAGDVVLDELAAEFMQTNPDIKVERRHLSYNELSQLFRAASMGESPPPLVRAPGELTGPFSELGIVLPMTDLVSPEGLRQFLPGALESASAGGKVWGLPDAYGGDLMLFYNEDLVTEVPDNTDAWISQLMTLTDPEKGQYGLVYAMNEPFWVVPWIAGYGGVLVNGQGQPALGTVAVAQALQFVQDLKLVHRVTPDTADYDTAYAMFRDGHAAYIIDGAWNYERYVGSGRRVGVAPLPVVSETGLRAAPLASGKHWFVSSRVDAARRDAALRFATFMTSDAAQKKWLARASRLPSRSDTGDAAVAAGLDPLLAGAWTQLRLSRGLPPVQQMPCIWSAMGPGLEEVMSGGQTPASAARAMQADAERCIEDVAGADQPGPTSP